MADRYSRPSRPPTRREVLGPGDSRANIDASARRAAEYRKPVPSSSPTPQSHHQTFMPNSSNMADARSSSPVASSTMNGRLSANVTDAHNKSKRDSEISYSSCKTSASKRKSYVGRWQLGKTIGAGGCSTVRLVRHRDTGQIGAAKIISRKMAEQVRAQSLSNLSDVPEKSVQDLVAAGKAPPPPPGLLREIAIMKLLNHENIVQLYDVWENRNELYLIMEYVGGGELFHYVEENRGLNEPECIYIFRQIVAALLYCHRLHIHHRDLKPENILLDREFMKVKLVDFGMAALQPEGKKLTTACGSPHYAAPEVIRSRPYDGAKADVWSCGVILYVMLTGMTPFNYDHEKNLHAMYAQIAAANYYMPPELSADAQDLLRRIFVADPRRRISMDEIWDHPFMHKHDQDWDYVGLLALKETWVGEPPKIENWTVTREDQLDREILRNMRTLWHSVPRPVLVRKLTSAEPNQEKYFYAALVKHREESMEDYTGGNDSVSYAASDYQHRHYPTEAPPVPTGKQHSQSQYSIMNDEHLRSSRTFAEGPPSASSYDPYRPSRYRMAHNGANYTKVTVHRRGESTSSRKAVAQHTIRSVNANRVDTLRKSGRNLSSSSLARQSVHVRTSMSRSTLARRSMSRQSMVSSVWPSSPPVVPSARHVTTHKRGVSFSHLRKSSVASAVAPQEAAGVPAKEPFTPALQAKARFSQHVQPAAVIDAHQSPSVRAENAVRSRKERAATPPFGQERRHKAATPSVHIRGEIRKASSELEKACEEAFFRTSISSSVYTSGTDKAAPYDTPPSSVSNRDSGHLHKDAMGHRPLPSLPVDTPNTFITRTLEETRVKLATRSAAQGDADARKFNEVLANLDRIIPNGGGKESMRVTSAPDAKSKDNASSLPAIHEESRREQASGHYDDSGHRNRSVTAPVYKKELYRPLDDPQTVRMVQPSSPNPSRPGTTVRKAGGESEDGAAGHSSFLSVPGPDPRLTRKKSHDSVVSNGSGGEETTVKKKSSWFRRWKEPSSTGNAAPAEAATDANVRQSQDKRVEATTTVEQTNVRMDSRAKSTGLVRDKAPPHLVLHQADMAQAPTVKSSGSADESKGFKNWFGGKIFGGKTPTEERPATAPAVPSQAAAQQYFSTTPPSPLPPNTPATATGISGDSDTRSWFARFLRLRPESKILCFNVPRARARTELFRLLREWQRHGIKDLVYFPQDNAITARVDKVNSLSIKPVSFRIELFVVLQNGKKVGLSLARCVQVRGAASSFREVVKVLERTCRERGVFVEDEEKWNELCEIIS